MAKSPLPSMFQTRLTPMVFLVFESLDIQSHSLCIFYIFIYHFSPQLTDTKILVRLFEEAKFNVLQGHYPCETEDYEYLAGILAWVKHGKYDNRTYGLVKYVSRRALPV